MTNPTPRSRPSLSAGTITFNGAVNGLDQKALHVYLYIDENWPEAERQLTCTDRLPMSRIQIKVGSGRVYKDAYGSVKEEFK